ncbi:energy-coupling factor ABC transporter ATP-binding protein [Levilactobacillus bambusae]|uniref:Energy-coupling factor transporter ATP-binding protein EcfA2 n=1 Tax=Levilactobacillus bambusae TaxID=2024736 RepID=A0A2V1MY52_9LACO|nr:energy-coupling factor ABC transporter ATP-binding protein [Levilactobacillus bambusae]PWF99953.1 energy-coupling factor ABC transporter ATP-binding protein [Levilactobacillus bambusae]
MAITFKGVTYDYQAGTPMSFSALKNIDLTVPDGDYLAVIGHTGSGKSTLVQHMNALLKPTSGSVTIGEREITSQTNNKDLKPLRKEVGMVFQFPEHQLFEETVKKDIMFGPMNFGKNEVEADQLADQMIDIVGLPENTADRSPFELSGGQMRRVAIAGVLAMQPRVLILDEPTAGLDPQGRTEMMAMFNRLHQEQGLTIILVTHQMEDVANYAKHVLVMDHGEAAKYGTAEEVFTDVEWLRANNLDLPIATQFAHQLTQRGANFTTVPLTTAELAQELARQLGGKRHE